MVNTLWMSKDFHLSHYRQFSQKLLPQHTENGQSLRFPPIRKVDLRGWPLNSENLPAIYQMTSASDVEPRLPRSDWLNERSAWVQRSPTQVNFAYWNLEEIVDFVRFLCVGTVASAILGEIADNVINGSLLDTLVQKLKKLMMNISNKTVRLKKKSKSVANLVWSTHHEIPNREKGGIERKGNFISYNFILPLDLMFSLVRWWDVACTFFYAWLHMLRGVLSKLLRSSISIIHRYSIHFTISVTKFALFWVLRVSICSKKPKPYHMSVVF